MSTPDTPNTTRRSLPRIAVSVLLCSVHVTVESPLEPHTTSPVNTNASGGGVVDGGTDDVVAPAVVVGPDTTQGSTSTTA